MTLPFTIPCPFDLDETMYLDNSKTKCDGGGSPVSRIHTFKIIPRHCDWCGQTKSSRHTNTVEVWM